MGLFNKRKKFLFDKEQETEIIKAIKDAEHQTSGEIRIHIEESCNGDSFERALQLFNELGMHQTSQKNGLLFYIAYESHKFSIVADSGINKVVPLNFWEDMKDLLSENFKKSEFLNGLKEAIRLSGEQLKLHFPYNENEDENELKDEISKG